MTQLTYTMTEAAEALGIGHQKLYDEINAGRLRTYRVGRRRYASAEAVHDYIRDREREAAEHMAVAVGG